MANELLFASSLDLLKESFLWAAAKGGNVQDCESLIEIGSDLNWRGSGGDTPLLAACRCGHSATVAFLLAKGADSTAVGDDSFNALHIAADRNDLVTISILLDAGLSMKIKTRAGLTAFDIAMQKEHDSICNRLMRTSRARNSTSAYEEPDADSSSSHSAELPVVGGDDVTPTIGRSSASNLRNLARIMFIASPPSSLLDEENDPPLTDDIDNDSIHMSPPRHRMISQKPSPLPSLRSSRQGAGVVTNNINQNENKIDRKHDILQQTQNAFSVLNSGSNFGINNGIGINGVTNNSNPKIKNTQQSYSIIGQNLSSSSGSSNNSMEHSSETVNSLRKLLEAEQKERKLSDAMLYQIQIKNEEILTELSLNMDDYKTIEDKYNQQNGLYNQLSGNLNTLNQLDLVQIVELEKILRQSLSYVEERKACLLKHQFDHQIEQRLCVICQTKEKSVVLLPCRHMCLCGVCADSSSVMTCPLCRHPIAHRISVYA